MRTIAFRLKTKDYLLSRNSSLHQLQGNFCISAIVLQPHFTGFDVDVNDTPMYATLPLPPNSHKLVTVLSFIKNGFHLNLATNRRLLSIFVQHLFNHFAVLIYSSHCVITSCSSSNTRSFKRKKRLLRFYRSRRPSVIKAHFFGVLNLRHHLSILFLFLPFVPRFRHADFVHQAKFHLVLPSAVSRDWTDVTLTPTVWSRNSHTNPRLSLDSVWLGHLLDDMGKRLLSQVGIRKGGH